MTLDHFIKQVNDELSQDCQIPFNIPKKSLYRTIDWAKKWFYRNYEYAIEEAYIYLKSDIYNTTDFKLDRSVCLDANVIDVHGVYQIGGSGLTGDFSFDRLIQQDILRVQNMMGTNAYQLDYYVIANMHYDSMKQYLSHPISFEYNINNHKFRLMGASPNTPLVLLINRAIEDQDLFEDELFFRYIMAQVKINLGRIIGTVNMPLVGNATIDYDSLKGDGKEELENIKTEIKENEGSDYFFSS